jgi:hypothetical protein
MPVQAHLIVGIPVNSLQDLETAAKNAGIHQHLPVNPEFCDYENLFSNYGCHVTLEGKRHRVSLIMCSDCDYSPDPFTYLSTNTITGEKGGSYMALGAEITSRYSPSLVDAGWDSGGRPEPFILDLDRLKKIEAEAQATWPEARILMMDFMH